MYLSSTLFALFVTALAVIGQKNASAACSDGDLCDPDEQEAGKCEGLCMALNNVCDNPNGNACDRVTDLFEDEKNNCQRCVTIPNIVFKGSVTAILSNPEFTIRDATDDNEVVVPTAGDPDDCLLQGDQPYVPDACTLTLPGGACYILRGTFTTPGNVEFVYTVNDGELGFFSDCPDDFCTTGTTGDTKFFYQVHFGDGCPPL